MKVHVWFREILKTREWCWKIFENASWKIAANFANIAEKLNFFP